MSNSNLEQIVELSRWLVSGDKLPGPAVERLGTVRVLAGKTYYVSCSWAQVGEARVFVDPNGEFVRTVELEAADDAGFLTVAELASVFGEYQVAPRVHWRDPQGISFSDVSPSAPLWCAVNADLKGGTDDIASAEVRLVSFVLSPR